MTGKERLSYTDTEKSHQPTNQPGREANNFRQGLSKKKMYVYFYYYYWTLSVTHWDKRVTTSLGRSRGNWRTRHLGVIFFNQLIVFDLFTL